MKKPIKIILIVLAVLVGLFAALLIWLTATQLNVKTETAVVTRGDNSTAAFAPGDEVSILSWNVGYAGLGEESDFFMDGGKQTRAPSKAIVEKNMDGIVATVQGMAADFTFLQEIDAGPSTHAYGIEEAGRLRTETQLDSAHALNYKCAFVPYPIPPIGRVNTGLMTLSTAPIASAERIALPSPFKWPVSVANLKRCLMPVYIDLEGTDAQLVLVNLHLEAYDDGEGKAAQTAALTSFLEQEYAKGNYVIAGGDFNQTFPADWTSTRSKTMISGRPACSTTACCPTAGTSRMTRPCRPAASTTSPTTLRAKPRSTTSSTALSSRRMWS